MRLMISFLITVISIPLLAQLPDETSGRVPELDAFHKPIYTLWHEAWPTKDIQTLKQLFPQIDSSYTILNSAVLPGILRDKQELWNTKRSELQSAVSEYRQSISGNDTSRILGAVENVHMLYEQMVRIVRPITKEIDDFHRVLYSLHHYYIPEKNIALIGTNAKDLEKSMKGLEVAILPKRWEKKKEKYNDHRKSLSEAVQKYVLAVYSQKPINTLTTLENMVHGRYLLLEKVFE
jgi:hypothetical protein